MSRVRYNRKTYFLITVLLFLTISILGCHANKEVIQPIKYNHMVHVKNAGLDCTDCHVGVEKEINATIPSIKKCKSCHTEMKGNSQAEAAVVKAVNENTEIPWNRIYSLPEHVFFSHRRHVKSGKIACSVCHGDVEKLVEPPLYQLVPIKMKTCLKCHDNKSISNDCITCHV